MNALIALLHFCEVHGPCVVYCTQAIHNTTKSLEDIHIPPLKTQPIPIARPVHHQPQASSITSCSTTPSSLRKNSLSSLTTTSNTTSSCAACTAQLPLVNTGQGITEAKRLVTLDQDDPSIQYIGTTKSPQQPHLYKAVRMACVRSLTAEFCQGRDGPVLFGDDENGYVMSYMFKLRDSQARGEARFYSLIMLMTDRVYLISCWPFLVSAFRSMALNLQERANMVFQREKEGMRHSVANSNRRTPMSPQDQFYRRRSHTALRSLVDLLGIKDIYAQIQAQFSYTLKLSSRKRMEKLTQGRRESPLYAKLKAEYQQKKQNATT
ncbi:hypothetical protein CU098_008651 [Rhizopus stolonifer]|uniref:UDENN FLCN/SMCR8-type domain-containing protein n=1 Tax=Rhizopus stolonifer TaxID=4846 RepID=A0A367KM95_RHIST|nr:hypothetical protein CU098_008651 [Rhizopus stolonifer]